MLMRRTHPLAGAASLPVGALEGARIVIPADELNTGFNRRLRRAVRVRAGGRDRDLGGRGVAAGRRPR